MQYYFPFEKISRNSRVVLYGAGNIGKMFYDQVKKEKYCEITLWLDQKADGILVEPPMTITKLNADDYDIVIIAIENEETAKSVKYSLMRYGVQENKIQHFADMCVRPPVLDSAKLNKLTSYDNNPEKETKHPSVRICVSTYNTVKFTRYCLNGILMQKTDFPFEIYIYDDCSMDGTSDILREYAQKYPNIILDIQQENLYSKNMDLQRKKKMSIRKNHNCKYTASNGGDDYWTDPYKLQLQVDFLENNDGFSMCSGAWITNDTFTGKQYLHAAVGRVYDFSTAHGEIYLPATFTRVYRTESLPEYDVTKKYKDFFRDIHTGYYVLEKGNGYHFNRIFGVYNLHSGGIWGGLSPAERIETNYKLYGELYSVTRNEQTKYPFIYELGKMLDENLKTEEQKKDFLEEFIETYPELSEDIELILGKHGLSNAFSLPKKKTFTVLYALPAKEETKQCQ